MKSVPAKNIKTVRRAGKVLVLGVGNILLSDEGVGVRAMEAFRKKYRLPGNVRCVDGGTMGLSLLDLLKAFTHVIIVDAVVPMGSPGRIHRFSWDGIPKGGAPALKTTVHQIGVSELLMLARFEGARPRVRIIGIEPVDLNPGTSLSPLIEKRLPLFVKALEREVGRLASPLTERRRRA